MVVTTVDGELVKGDFEGVIDGLAVGLKVIGNVVGLEVTGAEVGLEVAGAGVGHGAQVPEP